MGGRGRTAVLKGDSFPPIPNLEPWDGKDGEVSGGGQGRRWECDSMSSSVHVNAVGLCLEWLQDNFQRMLWGQPTALRARLCCVISCFHVFTL